MGKYVGYAILIFLIAFFLNWFNIVNISFLDFSDVNEKKHEVVYKSENSIKLLD